MLGQFYAAAEDMVAGRHVHVRDPIPGPFTVSRTEYAARILADLLNRASALECAIGGLEEAWRTRDAFNDAVEMLQVFFSDCEEARARGARAGLLQEFTAVVAPANDLRELDGADYDDVGQPLTSAGGE